MSYAIQWVRSLIYVVQFYIALALIGIVRAPIALFSPKFATETCRMVCRYAAWSAPFLIGLRMEVRGNPPNEECLVAAKHQSFGDVLMIFGAIPRGKFIMKNILKYAPIVGQYGLRIGCIPVQRGKRGQAIKQMVADVKAGRALPGQLIIYPQGTRISPGVDAPYKIGTAALYAELGQPCYPVATNVGVFWPKRGIYRAPGVAVVEFLPPIPPGLGQKEFMAAMGPAIEKASDRLAAEAGFPLVAK